MSRVESFRRLIQTNSPSSLFSDEPLPGACVSPLSAAGDECGGWAIASQSLGSEVASEYPNENENEGDEPIEIVVSNSIVHYAVLYSPRSYRGLQYHPLEFGQKLSLASLVIRDGVGELSWAVFIWSLLKSFLPFVAFAAALLGCDNGLYYDLVCTAAGLFGFCDRDCAASRGGMIMTTIFAIMWTVQFCRVFWPTAESHAVSCFALLEAPHCLCRRSL